MSGLPDEFHAPHAYIPGQVWIRRVRTATHGTFDVLLVRSPDGPLTAYTNSVLAEDALAAHPRLRVVRVAPGGLRIQESDDGRTVQASLEADDGPLREADLRIVAPPGTLARIVVVDEDPWGGTKQLRRTDLAVDAVADGHVQGAAKKDRRDLRNLPAFVTLGSHVQRA